MINQTKIRNFISENYLFSEDAEELDNDDSFLEKGIIDSTGVLELIMFIEDVYGIEVLDEEVIPDNFDSVKKLCAYLDRKVG